MFALLFLILSLFILGGFITNEHYIYPRRIKKINELIIQEDYEKALELLQYLPEKQKMNPAIQYQFYTLYQQQSQYFAALFHLNEIIKRGVFTDELNEVFIRVKIAELYEKVEKPKQAIREYEQVLELDPENFDINKRIGNRLFLMKNYAAALPYLEKAMAIHIDDPEILKQRALIYFADKVYDKALSSIDRCLEKESNDLEGFFLRGKLRLLNEDYRGAKEDMQIAMSDPKKADLANVLSAICFLRLGDKAKALKTFSKYLPKFNEDYSLEILEARYLYADTLLAEGRLKDCFRQLSMIQNSQKPYKDTADRLKGFTKVMGSFFLRNIYNIPIKRFIEENIFDALARVGQQIQKTKIVDPHCAALAIKKSGAPKEFFQFIIGFDFNATKTTLKKATEMIAFMKELNLSAAEMYSQMGLEADAEKLFADSDFDIHLITFEQLEKTLQGGKAL